MDFLNSILNEMGGGNSSEIGSIAKVLLANESGSKSSLLDTVVGSLKEKGMEDKVASWVGSGANSSISSSQLNSVLGSDMMATLSEKTGVPEKELSGVLASLLPVIVNQLTPNGKEEGDQGSMVSTGLGILKGFL